MPTADLLGYADRFSARPGETVRFMVSTTAGSYRVEIVRLTGLSTPGRLADAETVLPGVDYPGRVQAIHPGSYAVVPDMPALHLDSGFTVTAWLYPTLPARGRAQGIVSRWPRGERAGFALALDGDGRLALHLGTGQGNVTTLTSPEPLHACRWFFAAASCTADGTARLFWQELPRGWVSGGSGAMELNTDVRAAAANVPLLIGAMALSGGDQGHAVDTCNGKIERPRLWNRALSPEELEILAADGDVPADGLIGDWDFAAGFASTKIVDRSPSQTHGKTVSVPMRGVTGHAWDGSEDSFLARPEQYGAIAFHEDDLEDCGWEADFAFTVPGDLPSGAYAARLSAGASTEEIPFYVRPRLGAPQAPLLVLMPTNTYLAYANFRLNISNALAGRTDTPAGGRLSPTDQLLMELPALGSSLYDCHPDGTGICSSSRLRPILTMRSDAIETATNAPRHFAADLYLLAWLEARGFPYDVATDEDLQLDGGALLEPYRVVITGSHPEYWTGPALDAVEGYLAGGGRFMYLGGNGFYWVTAMDPARPHLIEMRRGSNGTRAWSSAPGESRLSLSGEPGGLWRYRGRAPNRLCGVGFASQGWDAAAGYVRLPESHDPRAAFIFADVGADEVIGDFGVVLNGAAGDEIDRYDLSLGTPEETLRLATSEGAHSDAFQLVVEDTQESSPHLGGATCRQVRADIVYLDDPGGGAVFSTGSINWIASLPHNGFANNVSRITENVLRRFIAGEDEGNQA